MISTLEFSLCFPVTLGELLRPDDEERGKHAVH